MKRNYDECVTKYSDSFVRVVLDPGYVSRIQNFVTELVEAKSKEDHHKIDSNKEVKRFTTGFLGEAALEKLFGILFIFADENFIIKSSTASVYLPSLCNLFLRRIRFFIISECSFADMYR